MIAAATLFAAFLLFAVAVRVPSVVSAMGSAEACGTCHFMEPHVQSIQKSSHRQLTCLDCHTAQGFFAKPYEEIKSASSHVWITLTNTEPDVIQIKEHSRRLMQANCQSCHSAVVHKIVLDGRNCTDCHRNTPHDRPNVLRN